MTKSKLHLRKGDKVAIISGEDKGKEGKVLYAMPKTGKIIVEGVNMITVHQKPRRQGQDGGIIHKEGAIYASKAMLICEKCNQKTKVTHKKLEDGKRVRVCKSCGEVLN